MYITIMNSGLFYQINIFTVSHKTNHMHWHCTVPMLIWHEFIKGMNIRVSMMVNSLAPGKCERNFSYVIFKQIWVIDGWDISCEIAPIILMSLDFTDDQSTLVQVMAWCRQATSHYLNQCWPRSLPPYGVTRPQRDNYFLKYIDLWQHSPSFIINHFEKHL